MILFGYVAYPPLVKAQISWENYGINLIGVSQLYQAGTTSRF